MFLDIGSPPHLDRLSALTFGIIPTTLLLGFLESAQPLKRGTVEALALATAAIVSKIGSNRKLMAKSAQRDALYALVKADA